MDLDITMSEKLTSEHQLTGTFSCPICGVGVPHSHTETEQKAYHEEQLRGQMHGNTGDGWIRSDLRRPKERGWYLCRGVEITHPEHPYNERDSQLSWFIWVRDAARHGLMDSEICEVLHFDPIYGGFTLRNRLGNAVHSGAESRWPVICHPKYWRELPEFKEPKR